MASGLWELKMTNKKIILGIVLNIFLVSMVSAIDISYCCEKTINGAWCQNSPQQNCNNEFRSIPTSCEATSYCKLGTCIDSQEGTCMENTPERVCEDNGGVWEKGAADEIPQCSLGCCLIGDEAAFVTQTRCKRLSSLYGLEVNFRTDLSSEMQCIASATSSEKGACVFEKEFERTCLFLTQKACSEIGVETAFHRDFLCSDETLGTSCGPTEQTRCVEGKDEVYFIDSCGNLANIYDSSKIKDKTYWSRVQGKSESCNPSSSNANSATCGNCDYYIGSTCKIFKRSEDKIKPNYGDNICRDLSCEYEGGKYSHGETWCAESPSTEDNLPGSRYFRAVCYNGDVTIEPCADYRQEICIESTIQGFSTAACRVNKWQDCISQKEEKDCENLDRRDCLWLTNKCVPSHSPGFNFWEVDSDSESLCSIANAECVVTYEKKLGGSKECIENCECLASTWKQQLNTVCSAIGDCGSSTNYLGIQGYS